MGKFAVEVPATRVPTIGVPQLSLHPNWEIPRPQLHEDVIAYTLRCAAMLISPPKIEGENEDTPCEVVADAVQLLADEVRYMWMKKLD